MEITEAGLIFCEHASQVLAAMDRLYDAFDSGESGMRHSISLGLFPFFRYTQVNKLLLSYFGEHRDMIGSLRTVENYHAFNYIANGTLDFAIPKCREDNIPDVDHIVLDREPYKILASADLSTRNKQFMDHIIRNYPKYQEG